MTPVDPAVSEALSPWRPGLFSLGVFAALLAVLVGILLFLAAWLNPRRKGTETDIPYECGIVPTGEGRFRHPARFYLVALFFLIFELETVFIVTWALSFEELHLARWLQITVFILVLLASLFYVWGKGGLEWSASRKR
jgi:NADH-quinone oxidoreductase subunit A